MPIIKVTCTEEYMNFNLDISLRQKDHYGLECISLVKNYLATYKNLEYLTLVIKHILKLNDLNDPFKGGISSYGIVLMIVFYLQNYKKNYNVEISCDQEKLGGLLLGFFYYYGIYDKLPKNILVDDLDKCSYKLNLSVSFFKLEFQQFHLYCRPTKSKK
jgi:non-canonical poly(A) RNA polymerase PAPD5/7